MKIVIKDMIKLTFLFSVWFILYFILNCPSNNIAIAITDNFPFLNELKLYKEVINILPFYLFICWGYYAGISICYNITFINDCEKEYDELILDIENERKILEKNLIKFN